MSLQETESYFRGNWSCVADVILETVSPAMASFKEPNVFNTFLAMFPFYTTC